MNQESTAVSTITPEQQALLDQHAKQFSGKSGSAVPSIPRLKIAKEADPANEIEVGDFFVTKRVKNDKDEWVDKVKGLGKNPTVTILLMKHRYSWYDNSISKFVIQTNEFDSFAPDERIIVFDEGRVTHDIEYAEFKKLKETEWRITNPRGGSVSALKLSYVLYVELGGLIAALTVPLSSYCGTNAEGKRDFKAPEAGSLLALQNANVNLAPYAYTVQLAAQMKSFINEKSKQKVEYFRTIFTKMGSSNVGAMIEKRQSLDKALEMIDDAKYTRGTSKDDIVPIPQDDEESIPDTELLGTQPTAPTPAPASIGPSETESPAGTFPPVKAEQVKVDPFAI